MSDRRSFFKKIIGLALALLPEWAIPLRRKYIERHDAPGVWTKVRLKQLRRGDWFRTDDPPGSHWIAAGPPCFSEGDWRIEAVLLEQQGGMP